jgi:hypothetical protein
MLTYTMSEDGNRATISGCVGGGVRLSIIRICKAQGWPLPPEVLEEDADIEILREMAVVLHIRRTKQRIAQSHAERARQQAAEEARERLLPPDAAAKVADLRQRAADIRAASQRADRAVDVEREMAKARRLEAEASRIISSNSGSVMA